MPIGRGVMGALLALGLMGAAAKPPPAATARTSPVARAAPAAITRLPANLVLSRRALTPAGVLAAAPFPGPATPAPAPVTRPIVAAPVAPTVAAPYSGPEWTPTSVVAAGVSFAIPGGGQLIEGSPVLAAVFAGIEAAAIAGLWAGSSGGSLPLWAAGAGLLVANHVGATSEIFYSGRSVVTSP